MPYDSPSLPPGTQPVSSGGGKSELKPREAPPVHGQTTRDDLYGNAKIDKSHKKTAAKQPGTATVLLLTLDAVQIE